MRAENGTQTRDPQLGRLVLYRLSYFRKIGAKILRKTFALCDLRRCGCGWIRTTEAEKQQIYSLPHLATLEHTQFQRSLSESPFTSPGASCRTRTNDRLITNRVLYQLS